MYTLKEIKKLKTFEEEDFDESRKLFATEFLKALREKKILAIIIIFLTGFWFLSLRYQI